MALFDAEHLIGQLLVSELGGGARRGRRKRLSRSVRSAALSPQGLTLLGGIAIAAIEHLRNRSAVRAVPSSPTQSFHHGGQAPPALPGSQARTTSAAPPERPANLPPIPGAAPPEALPPVPSESLPTVIPIPGSPTPEQEEFDRKNRVLVRAMVEAAKADGEVDPAERARILEQLQTAGADAAARRFVAEQLDRPLDLDGLLVWVGSDDPTLPAQIYVASRVVIADETPAESAYLALLAARLGLSDELVRELRSQVDRALESTHEE